MEQGKGQIKGYSLQLSHISHFKSANMIAGEIVLAYPLCNYDPEKERPALAGCFFLLFGKRCKMVNLQPKINKLVKALRLHGAMVKINTQQYFSEKQGRVCTKWILWEEHPNRDGETFYSKAELLKTLAERWREVIEIERAEKEE